LLRIREWGKSKRTQILFLLAEMVRIQTFFPFPLSLKKDKGTKAFPNLSVVIFNEIKKRF
jgi:hypothetical protein